MTFLMVALQSEARPLVRHFGLTGTDAPSPYRIYGSDEITLVVTGVGRVACAAATAYAFAHAGEARNRAWINVGIAGHASAAVGSARVANKITERGTGRAWYPNLVFDSPVPTAELVTVDEPELNGPGEALYDMEGSAFFAVASRFSVIELLHVFKVVSDNDRHGLSRIDRVEVARLIGAQLDAVETIVAEAGRLARHFDRQAPDLEPWTSSRRLSVSQTRMLADLLARLRVLEASEPLPSEFSQLAGGRELLAALEERVRRQGLAF
ncbi:MAG: hypothetical protein ACE5GX_06005 [Thermoanaerobaculia bacterium]